jgi:hypothetical protein
MLSGSALTVTTDADAPNPDEGFWYLIQGGNDCGRGPFGNELHGFAETPRETTTCP